MEWTKFKNILPQVPFNSAVYVTDYKSVWISYLASVDSWNTYGQNHPENAWAQIPLPELPKKELHCCVWNKFSNDWFCQELPNGTLELVGPLRISERIIVRFCPFCGYSPKNSNIS